MKLILIAGLGLLAVTQARALSPFDALSKDRAAGVSGCADFSGHWKGVCQVQGVTSSDEQTAVQDGCRGIHLKNLNAPIGGTYSIIETFPANEDGTVPFVSNSITTQWDSSRQVVQFTETANNRHIGGLAADKPLILTGEMKKLDGKLQIALQRDGQTVISCEYEKQ